MWLIEILVIASVVGIGLGLSVSKYENSKSNKVDSK
jgi:hypothetical protein